MKTEQKWKIGDCLELMKELPDNSVDLILTDPPYNVLQLEWDKNIIDWKVLTNEFYRILKPKGSIYIFGQMPMIFEMYSSFVDYFKFKQDLIWYKNRGFSLCDTIFTKYHENILYFIKPDNEAIQRFSNEVKEKRIKKGYTVKFCQKHFRDVLKNFRYYEHGGGGWLWFETGKIPSLEEYELLISFLGITDTYQTFFEDKQTFNFDEIKTVGKKYTIKREKQKLYGIKSNMGKHVEVNKGLRNPKTVLEYNIIQGGSEYVGHPTQKPLKLIEYLIRASSNEGDVVLDPFLGSGTTLEACMNTNRNCIGFEISNEWEPYYIKRTKQDLIKLDNFFRKQ